MKWDDIQKQGLKDGSLVYALDQGQTAPVVAVGPWGGNAQGGYCSGLSARWIALRYIGADYPYDAATRECTNPDWQATRDHTLQADDAQKGFPAKYKRTLGQYGLTYNKGTLKFFKGFPASEIVMAVNAFRGYALLSMWGKGGHGTAIGRGAEYKSAWHFFDPNYGEFTFPTVDGIVKFLDRFFLESDYRTLFKSSGVVGVNPPPYVLGDLKELTRIGWKLA